MNKAYSLDSREKVEQEKKSLRQSGDFFQKIIVENGYRDLRPDEDGIFRVGIIPFLLDATLLDGIIREAKSSPPQIGASTRSELNRALTSPQ